ncbi:MAG: DUF1684 domain-containing protein [Chloroflexi bacterium]|nr:MAG: DUF1684 domain-containing protein [Chloroflexota bacterium]
MGSNKRSTPQSGSADEYEDQILQWRARKYQERVGENGWLTLAGLAWLNPGRNLIGSNPMCEVILPEHAPTFLGIVEWKGKTTSLQVAEGVQVQVNGKAVQKTVLRSDQDAKPSYITWNKIRMVLHEYAGKFGIRIWDNQRRNVFTLPLLKWFPINRDFRFNARYTRYPEPRVSDQPDTFGGITVDRMDGYVTFKFEGKTYKLDVTEEKDHRLFIKFRDLTNNKETYPPSRYYYTEPVKDGKVILDFNYAYSPPCAFTEYATCIFAPQQNNLPFRVEAGEIYRG